MSYQEKTIQCCDCGASFPFTVEEQELFASRGYTNEPKRCTSCRQIKKAERTGGGFRPQQRQMYTATCAECGQTTEVPFEPRQGRPVYCRTCYAKVQTNR